MGIYVYVARKRPIDVRLGDGSVVKAYPLTYVSKLVDFNRFFDSHSSGYWREFYKESWKERMQIARSQRAFEDEKVEYVYISSLERNPVPFEGHEVYKIDSLGTADKMAYDMDSDSACAGGPEIFWADCEDPGKLQGALVAPVRVGRKKGPWTLTPVTKETEEQYYANARRERARRHAQKEARRCG